MKKWIVPTLAVGLVVAVSALCVTGRRVRTLEERLARQTAEFSRAEKMRAEERDADDESEREEKTVRQPSATTNAPAALQVVDVEYKGGTDVLLFLNRRPDMGVLRRYLTVSPLRRGTFGFHYQTRYSRRFGGHQPVIRVTGDFAYRTNVTLRLRKGFPLYGKGANPSPEGSLGEDFVHVFRRNDPTPNVCFADAGRYLPPGGSGSVRLETVGVGAVATQIRRVEPRNIVQLLAREERVYRRGRWIESVDDEDTDELAGECETGLVRCVNRPCEFETVPVRVAMNDGGPERGIFLLTVRDGGRPREECEWRKNVYNPNRYRLVCLSDFGLSVRRTQDGVGVWVTSLQTGRPVGSVDVAVYSSANTLVAQGVTDARGWCATGRVAKGEPFAVVASAKDGGDRTFLALRESMCVDETQPDGCRDGYLRKGEVAAFVWTERGIYRHGERIFVHTLLRDGDLCAPKPMPVVLKLRNPEGDVFAERTTVTDALGAVEDAGFSVPADQPSGQWTVEVALPGRKGRVLASREVKVEEFAPPQIRVNVSADAARHPSNFTFRISAEHLFGGPARTLACEGAVVFEDVPFAPARWKGFRFGNDDLGLKPCFRRMSRRVLDEKGGCVYEAPLWADSGRPKAAVRATGQGTVFEDGGRPATARKSVVCHYYSRYVGSDLPEWLRMPQSGRPTVGIVCVDTEGNPVRGVKLVAKLERIDSVYSYRRSEDGWSTWDCNRVRSVAFDDLPLSVGETGKAAFELPVRECGDYALTVTDPSSGASFGRTFYLSDWGDSAVRAPLANPTEVTLQPDKAFYRVGETPRMVVKAPFAGHALMTILRDGLVRSEVLNLTNATSEVVLPPVERAWAPNADVAISVVQSVAANEKHLAVRAHGQTTIRVRPVENEIEVKVESRREKPKSGEEDGGSRVLVEVTAKDAREAVVTLVDEGINLLTAEPTPDPVGCFAAPRTAEHPLFDLYHRILPVVGDGLKASGVKTGGGFGAEMLGRVSPVPTRRFRPLALWQTKIAVADGRGRAVFDLPEFVGEVRVTALAYSDRATGAASVRQKVAPNLIMQPDAPRFVAPRDAFEVTLPLRNAGDADGEVAYEIPLAKVAGRVRLARGDSTNVVARLAAPDAPGEMSVLFRAKGLGETHAQTLLVPVRPAVAWRERAGLMRLEPGESSLTKAEGPWDRFSLALNGSPLAELVSALEWLSDYPHGCLEQTASRIFPLIAAGGLLNSVASKAATNRAEYVAAGVRRVESMIRATDFVMWPDCNCAPWDREVSLYAAHFLVEAEKAGTKLQPATHANVVRFLKRWAMETNACVSAYACHTLALAGCPEKDRMFRLYDRRESLGALSRARLARAFAAIRDAPRAEALMSFAYEPQSVREAAFRVLALLDLNPDDPRLPGLVAYLTAKRDKSKLSWGTTAENAHALLAIAAYGQRHPVRGGEPKVAVRTRDAAGAGETFPLASREGRAFAAAEFAVTNVGAATAFVSWRARTLPDAASVADESRGLFISRRYLDANDAPVDLANLVRGEMLVVELTVTSDVTRVVGDLVIEDLFAGAFEPVHRELESHPPEDWVMRKDARDDRMLVFSKRFTLERGREAKVCYPVRVVSAGDFVLPGPSVEAMYNPELRSVRAPARIKVR